MSWIREHYRQFVWPGLEALRRGPGQTLPSPAPLPDWVATLKEQTLHQDEYHPELRMLRAFYRNMHSWMLAHLGQPRSFGSGEEWGGTVHHEMPWEPQETWRRVRNSFQSVTAEANRQGGKTLLLAGRDVWVYEVLCRRHNVTSIFAPEVSRNIASNSAALQEVIRKYKITGDELLVDTGFVGSIPKAFSRVMKKEMAFYMLSQNPIGWIPKKVSAGTIDEVPQQIFPNMKGSRSLALWMEYLPKYYTSGKVKYGHLVLGSLSSATPEVEQHLSRIEEFIAAAVLTSCVWRGIPDWFETYKWVKGARAS